MKISYDEPSHKYTIDMEGAMIVTNRGTTLDASMTECECTAAVSIVNDSIVAPERITAWNLMFNGNIKELLKRARNGS